MGCLERSLMTDEDRKRELMTKEVEHAQVLLGQGWTFDNLADAAETLARAANRVAPMGYRVVVMRED